MVLQRPFVSSICTVRPAAILLFYFEVFAVRSSTGAFRYALSYLVVLVIFRVGVSMLQASTTRVVVAYDWIHVVGSRGACFYVYQVVYGDAWHRNCPAMTLHDPCCGVRRAALLSMILVYW